MTYNAYSTLCSPCALSISHLKIKMPCRSTYQIDPSTVRRFKRLLSEGGLFLPIVSTIACLVRCSGNDENSLCVGIHSIVEVDRMSSSESENRSSWLAFRPPAATIVRSAPE